MGRVRDKHAAAAAELAVTVRKARRKAQLSQEAVARLADVSIGTVRNIEQSVVTDPGVFEIAAIARTLNTTVDALLSAPVAPTSQGSMRPPQGGRPTVGARPTHAPGA